MQLRTVPFQHSLDSFRKIDNQMKTISNLNGVRSAGIGAFGIQATSISCDDFQTRLLLQPEPQFICRTSWKKVYDSMTIQINQNRPVVLTFLPRPIIDSEMPNRLIDQCRIEGFGDRTQHAIVANRNCEAVQQAASWQTSCSITNQTNDF